MIIDLEEAKISLMMQIVCLDHSKLGQCLKDLPQHKELSVYD